MGLTLFGSRWVLSNLGQSDFGLYSVVGSIIVFIVFLNNIMASSGARFFAYSLGRGDHDDVNHWFNATFSVHLCLAFILIIVGWPIGEYVVRHVLTIPEGRMEASLFVFRISLLSAFISMLSVPFLAMYTAKQKIAELALWALIQSFFSFLLAWLLHFVHGDKLVIYAAGMVSILVVIQIIRITQALFAFRECRIMTNRWFAWDRLREVFTFAIWSVIGGLGAMLRDQGSSLLLNVYFGPRLNAAYGVATQLSSQTNQLSSAMLGAFSPEITASEGRGDRRRMLRLANKAGKFGTILILFFAIPLLLEMDYVLKLWLHTPPEHAATFCRWILATFLVDRLSSGSMLAVNAHGRIGGYQATIGGLLLLTLPLAWLFLRAGLPPTSVGVAFLTTMTLCSFGRTLWTVKLFGIGILDWMRSVVLPAGIVGATASCVGWIPYLLLPSTFARLALVIVSTSLAGLVATWLVAMEPDDKERFAGFAGKFKSSLMKRGSGT